MTIPSNSIILLGRNGLKYVSNLSPTQIFQLEFPKNIVSDLEIIDKIKFLNLLEQFIKTNRIAPSRYLIILSPEIYIQKDLISDASNPISLQIHKFLSFIPFQEICYKTYPEEKKVKIIAANKNYYDEIIKVLNNNKFSVFSVIPFHILHKYANVNLLGDPQIFIKSFERFDYFKSESIHEQISYSSNESGTNIARKKSRPNSSLVLLAPVFVVLVAFLLFMLFKNNQTPKPNQNLGSSNVILTEHPQKPVEPITPINENNIQNKSQAVIKIINGSGIKNQEEIVKKQLENSGFSGFEIESNQNITTPDTLLVFSNKIDLTSREKITESMKKLFPSVNIQETDDPKYNVIIVIGKVI